MKIFKSRLLKKIQMSFMIFILLSTISMTYANSGPTIIEEYPSSEMIVDASSEIVVNNETLIFDLSSDVLYSEGASVKATYEMQNTSDRLQNVHMIFPLVSTSEMIGDNVSINCDGEPIAIEKIYLDTLHSPEDLPDFETLLKRINEKGKSENRFLNSDLRGYTFIPHETINKMRVEVEFSLSDRESMILVQNANGYGYDSEANKYTVSCWVRVGESSSDFLKIYLTKGELENLKYTIVDSVNDETVSQSAEFEVIKVVDTTVSNANMKELLEKMMFAESIDLYSSEIRQKLLNEAINELYETTHIPMLMLEDLGQYLFQDRIVLLSYDIAFEPNQDHEVTVEYRMKGTFDKRNSSEPTYTFEYFLKPASYWKDFKQLELSINLEKPYEYIISSSLPLVRKVDQNQVSYTAVLDQLPESDLIFTVYTADKISSMDQLKGKWGRKYSYLFYFIGYFMVLPIVLVVIGFAIILGIQLMVKVIKRKMR